MTSTDMGGRGSYDYNSAMINIALGELQMTITANPGERYNAEYNTTLQNIGVATYVFFFFNDKEKVAHSKPTKPIIQQVHEQFVCVTF